jgi:predicted phosphodiesterase
LGDIGKIEIDRLKFCIYHGQDIKKKRKLIDSGKFDVFIYGHSHTRYPKEEETTVNNHTIVLNPGSAHRAEKTFYSIPQYFNESSIMIFDTTSKKFEFIEL